MCDGIRWFSRISTLPRERGPLPLTGLLCKAHKRGMAVRDQGCVSARYTSSWPKYFGECNKYSKLDFNVRIKGLIMCVCVCSRLDLVHSSHILKVQLPVLPGGLTAEGIWQHDRFYGHRSRRFISCRLRQCGSYLTE